MPNIRKISEMWQLSCSMYVYRLRSPRHGKYKYETPKEYRWRLVLH